MVGSISNLRIGSGFDAHRFADKTENRKFWLAGLLWEDQGVGLEGHSDADVAVHALIDAVLSAANQTDIGSVFGVDRAETKNASSMVMLKDVMIDLSNQGYRILNASVQIVGNRPRFSSRREEAEKVLSDVLGAPVSISATTTDGMGFIGKGEGIAAISQALLVKE